MGLIFLLHFILHSIINNQAGSPSFLRSGANEIKPKADNEMLIPRYSTTVLMCEPIFTATNNSQAQWYHNGLIVANVSSSSNAVLHNRTYNIGKTIPNVGFLIITNITVDDEGDYWCQRTDNKQEGKMVRITVAYLEQFPDDSRPKFDPMIPSLGQHVSVQCPSTKAVPPPSYTWFLNKKPVDLSTRRIIQNINGSLRIQQFSRQDIGVYECVVANFAGRTSAKIFVDAVELADGDVFGDTAFSTACKSIFRSSVSWFFIGCLMMSIVVLSYLMCTTLSLQRNCRNRTSHCPNLIFRTHPNLAPGFRKVIAPILDAHYVHRTTVFEHQII